MSAKNLAKGLKPLPKVIKYHLIESIKTGVKPCHILTQSIINFYPLYRDFNLKGRKRGQEEIGMEKWGQAIKDIAFSTKAFTKFIASSESSSVKGISG